MGFLIIKGLITELCGRSAPLIRAARGAAPGSAAMGCASSAALPREPQQAGASGVPWGSIGNYFGTS